MNDVGNLRDTIIPKSDQLNADDLIGTNKTITITAVKRGDAEQPVSIEYDGMEGRPYKPCKSMRRVLIAAWGDNGREWVGNKIKLFSDPEIKFGGIKVGGIRISHLSGIDSDMSVLLATSRGKRSQYDVKKLKDGQANYPQKSFDANCQKWIAAVVAGQLTIERIKSKCTETAPLSAQQLDFLQESISGLIENGEIPDATSSAPDAREETKQ